VAVAGQVKDDNAVRLGEVWQLGAPVAGIATPTVYEQEGRFASTMDLIGNAGAIPRRNYMGPYGMIRYRLAGR